MATTTPCSAIGLEMSGRMTVKRKGTLGVVVDAWLNVSPGNATGLGLSGWMIVKRKGAWGWWLMLG